MRDSKYLETEDAVVLNKYLALAKQLYMEREGEICGKLENRIATLGKQLPLIEALSEINFEAETDAEKLHEIIEETRKASAGGPNLLEEESAWIRKEGFAKVKAAVKKLEELGGWPPKKVEKPASPAEPDSCGGSGEGAVDGKMRDLCKKHTRRVTVTGLDQDGVDSIMKKLYDTKVAYDAEAISTLLRYGIQKGVHENEIRPYQETYHKLCQSDYVTGLLRHSPLLLSGTRVATRFPGEGDAYLRSSAKD